MKVADGKIVVAATCDDSEPPGHCKHIWSRMNAIYIKQMPEENDDDDGMAQGTVNMGCGNSYKGGRCADKTDPENCVYGTV